LELSGFEFKADNMACYEDFSSDPRGLEELARTL
jgi:hypothetical protein